MFIEGLQENKAGTGLPDTQHYTTYIWVNDLNVYNICIYIYIISSIPAHPQIRRMKLQLDKEPPGTTWKYLESLVEKG